MIKFFFKFSTNSVHASNKEEILLRIAQSNPFSNRPHAFNHPDGSFFCSRERNKSKEKGKETT